MTEGNKKTFQTCPPNIAFYGYFICADIEKYAC